MYNARSVVIIKVVLKFISESYGMNILSQSYQDYVVGLDVENMETFEIFLVSVLFISNGRISNYSLER